MTKTNIAAILSQYIGIVPANLLSAPCASETDNAHGFVPVARPGAIILRGTLDDNAATQTTT